MLSDFDTPTDTIGYLTSLNAPYGARCFLTYPRQVYVIVYRNVLMHLMALGAFWPNQIKVTVTGMSSLNAPYGARCFLTEERQTRRPQRGWS